MTIFLVIVMVEEVWRSAEYFVLKGHVQSILKSRGMCVLPRGIYGGRG